MLYFENDYCEGAHPAILQKLTETNFEKVSGYGTDPYCASAKEKIRAACACPEADVFFISGGTQANSIVIASTLRRWEGVIAAATGHVAGHEAGAIEFTGHKVIGLPQKNGKLDAATVEDFCKTFYADSNHDHMVFPGMVYISHPTEYGTLYSKAELEALSAVCHTYHMPLFVDGARLGYALVSEGTDVTLADLARLTDVFYIGGTKVGALCGEAVVFPHPVRRSLHRRPLHPHQPQRHRDGQRPQEGPRRKGLPLLYGLPHQPALRRAGKRPAGRAGRQGKVRLLGEVRRQPHRRPHRHQLGH